MAMRRAVIPALLLVLGGCCTCPPALELREPGAVIHQIDPQHYRYEPAQTFMLTPEQVEALRQDSEISQGIVHPIGEITPEMRERLIDPVPLMP